MDYKKLIAALRDENNCDVLDYIDNAAAAIETLLAEREAAVKGLRDHPRHTTCKHGKECGYISAMTGLPDCYSCDDWEWRGLEEHKNDK